jgi:hypothetical protein
LTDSEQEPAAPKPAAAGERAPGWLARSLFEPLRSPTGKQKESYARYLQTLSAACLVGSATVAYGSADWITVLRAGALALIGIVLFFVAAPLAKGVD